MACVEVTTTPVSTTATGLPSSTTSAMAPPVTTTSGTTTIPTSVLTTTACRKDMAIVGRQYVKAVQYSTQPITGTRNTDLTNATSQGISFPDDLSFVGLRDPDDAPLYNTTIFFNEPGVDSLGSFSVNSPSNVAQVALQFYEASQPNKLVPLRSDRPDQPLTVVSDPSRLPPRITDGLPQLNSPLIAIRVIILTTTDNR